MERNCDGDGRVVRVHNVVVVTVSGTERARTFGPPRIYGCYGGLLRRVSRRNVPCRYARIVGSRHKKKCTQLIHRIVFNNDERGNANTRSVGVNQCRRAAVPARGKACLLYTSRCV